MKTKISIFLALLVMAVFVSAEPTGQDELKGMRKANEEKRNAKADKIKKEGSKAKQPLVRGNYYDSQIYDGMCSVSKGATSPPLLVFFATFKFNPTYIFLQDDRTFDVSDNSRTVGSTILTNDKNQKSFIPFYFMKEFEKNVIFKISNQVENPGCFEFEAANSKVKKIFPGVSEGFFRICLLKSLDAENVDFVVANLNDLVQKAYLKHDDKAKLILEHLRLLEKFRLEIEVKRTKFRELNRNTRYKMESSLGNIIKVTIQPKVENVFTEALNLQSPLEVLAAKLCDVIYVNGDFSIFEKYLKPDRVKLPEDSIVKRTAREVLNAFKANAIAQKVTLEDYNQMIAELAKLSQGADNTGGDKGKANLDMTRLRKIRDAQEKVDKLKADLEVIKKNIENQKKVIDSKTEIAKKAKAGSEKKKADGDVNNAKNENARLEELKTKKEAEIKAAEDEVNKLKAEQSKADGGEGSPQEQTLRKQVREAKKLWDNGLKELETIVKELAQLNRAYENPRTSPLSKVGILGKIGLKKAEKLAKDKIIQTLKTGFEQLDTQFKNTYKKGYNSMLNEETSEEIQSEENTE